MRFPIFITDAILLWLSIASVALAFIFPGPVNFVLAILAAAITAVVVKKSNDALLDFERSVSDVEALAWKPVFLSAGALELDYCGKKMIFTTAMLGERDGALPVDYRLSFPSGNRSFLEAVGTERPGEPDVRGDKKLYAKIRKPVAEFDAKYGLSFVRNRDGMLEFSVCLGFSKEPYPKEAKLSDMASFLRDYLALSCAVGKALA